MLWFHLAWKEIKNNSRFSLFFILNLSLGLVGFITLDSFKQSVQEYLLDNSKAILTADLQLSSREPLGSEQTEPLAKLLPESTVSTSQISFLSMVAANNNSRMSMLLGIEELYPLYGDIKLQNSGSVFSSSARQSIQKNNEIWVARDLMLLLDLDVGDSLRIGEADFTIGDVILEDPSSTISVMTSFPAIYMSLANIERTGLIQLGSRISYSRFYRVPRGFDVETLKPEFQRLQRDSSRDDAQRINIETHGEESADLARILQYMNDYLGLIALIALFLAGVGAAYLFRAFFTTRFKDMAILMCLGGTPQQAYIITLLQIILLGSISALLACMMAWILMPLLPSLFADFLPRGFTNTLPPSSLLLAFVMGTIGSIACCLPILAKISELNTIALFHENIQQTTVKKFWQRQFPAYFPVILVFWSLALWQANSFLIATLFVGSFLLALAILGMAGWFMLGQCSTTKLQNNIIVRLALRNLVKNRLPALSCFLAIALGALLINLIPQIQKGLQQEIAQPTDYKLPDFFMFDIQEEQLAELQSLLSQRQQAMSYVSPMVRARLDMINEEVLAELDEDSDRQMQGRRMFNLTFQESLKSSEDLIEGVVWEGPWDYSSENLPGISVEQYFAERTGLKLGDTLTFDVQGVPITGQIINLRKVEWNSFQPNFFLSFQPGVLEPAPKTFIAAISEVAEEERLSLQNAIVATAPNVSVINVSQIVGRLLDITNQISWAIKVMAWLAILAGLVVLFSIARYEVQARSWEINLMKILGGSFTDVRLLVQIEFGVLGLSAALCGVIISLVISWGISWVLFDALWRFSLFTTGFSIVAITALSMLTALTATFSVLRQKPLALLRSI